MGEASEASEPTCIKVRTLASTGQLQLIWSAYGNHLLLIDVHHSYRIVHTSVRAHLSVLCNTEVAVYVAARGGLNIILLFIHVAQAHIQTLCSACRYVIAHVQLVKKQPLVKYGKLFNPSYMGK